MLTDTARKVKRILYNHHFFEKFELDVLSIAKLSLRTDQQVKDAINELVKEKELLWHKETNTFQVVRYLTAFLFTKNHPQIKVYL